MGMQGDACETEDDMTEIREYRIEDGAHLALMVTKIKKINKRADKRGLGGGYLYAVAEKIEPQPFPRPAKVFQVLTVTGEAPCLNGWRFLAAIDNDSEVGVTTRTIPGFDGEIPRDWIKVGWCEHCQTARYRKNTYVLESTDTGVRVQVGSSCIKDFLGHTFSGAWLTDTDDLDEEYEGWGGGYGGERRFATADVITYARVATRLYGWKRSSEPGSTRELVQDVLMPPTRRGPTDLHDPAKEVLYATTEDDYAKAAEIQDWVLATTETGEYMSNLRAVCAAKTVTFKHLGLLVSAPSTWARAQERETNKRVEREQAATSEYVGTVKERLRDLHLTVTGTRYFEGDYGTTTLILMTDEATGSRMKWFASGTYEFDAGEKVTLDGTVKAHEEYQGVKATVLTRCRIKETVEVSA